MGQSGQIARSGGRADSDETYIVIAKLTRCGDDLCAKVGRQATRYGSDGEYVLLEP